MRSSERDRKAAEDAKPKIWSTGGQRPPFNLRALGRATLFLSREGIAPLHAWAARRVRRLAVNVANGVGRIPADKLGRAARFVPSHLRVAAWIKNGGAALAHASANADPDVARGNALVAEIEPHLWGEAAAAPTPALAPTPAPAPAPTDPEAAGTEAAVGPVVLPEPDPPEADPLASIRDDLGRTGPQGTARPVPSPPPGPATPPAPPGAVATAAIQVTGYLIGWASILLALPYGLIRALWLWLHGRDLKTIGRAD
jgi:hypothetical protein